MIKNRVFSVIKISIFIIVVWIVQTLFLYQASRVGLNGWDDWGMLFYYDAYRANDLSNFPRIANEMGTPYLWTEIYNIGPLKDIFGLHQMTFKYLQLFFKSLAALSIAYLVFKLTKDKLFAFFSTFFFIILPSTAGILSHIIFIGGYLTIVFICISVFYYIKSINKPRSILLAALFFFLALLVCPPRAYFILPVPLVVELIRLKNTHRIGSFLKRLFIFYSPLIFLQSRPGSFIPHLEMLARFQQLISGNLYSLSFPFQAISALFVDKVFLIEALDLGKSLLPFTKPELNGFIILNFILLILSLFLGFVIKGNNFIRFGFKVMGFTLLIEAIFYLLGIFSVHDGVIKYVNSSVNTVYTQTLFPSIYQATLGGYYLVLGLVLAKEWWKHQKDNKILKITLAGWFWALISEIILYLTNHWYSMIEQSYDRYIIVSSLGAVIFIAGIYSLSLKSLVRIKNLFFRFLLVISVLIITVFFTWKNYKLLDQVYSKTNKEQGGDSVLQDDLYKRFLYKFGEDNLTKYALIYIDSSENPTFNDGVFVFPMRFRIYYDQEGNLIRSNCKVITNDIKTLRKSYINQDKEKGFLYDSTCVDPVISFNGKSIFYSLNDFYAYRIENKEFLDIKKKVLEQLE